MHVLNIDSLAAGVPRMLSFVLKVGNSKLWSAVVEHDITEPTDSPTDTGTFSTGPFL